MQYTWDSRAAFEMAAMPKAAAGKLKLASKIQLQVLMWLCCVGQGRFDAAACSVSCGAAPELCEEALAYWVEEGLVVLEGVPAKGMHAPVAIPAPVVRPAEPTPVPVTLPEKPQVAQRPTQAETLQAMSEDAAFYFMVQTASSRLGKAVTPNDYISLYYIYRDYKLPPEVILMIIGYAVKNGKTSLAYIEKTAINWAESGINTIAAADAHLCRIEHTREAFERVCRLGDMTIERPSVKQRDTAYRWVYEWAMPDEVIAVALAVTQENIGKINFSYTDKLLDRLRTEEVTTAQAAKEALAPQKPQKKTKASGRMKTASDRPPSFDLGEYEQMALRHRPKLPSQEG